MGNIKIVSNLSEVEYSEYKRSNLGVLEENKTVFSNIEILQRKLMVTIMKSNFMLSIS